MDKAINNAPNTMKKRHLLAIACASALPLATASAQHCGGYSRSPARVSFSFGFSTHGYSHAPYRAYPSRSYAPVSRYGSHYRGNSYGYQRSRSSCGSDRIRLVGGYQRGKGTRPSGWHDRSWYVRRGYNLDNYAHKHERGGDVHYGRNVRRR